MSESQAATEFLFLQVEFLTRYVIELRKEIKQIREENERLRELITDIRDSSRWLKPSLRDRIVKELGDE